MYTLFIGFKLTMYCYKMTMIDSCGTVHYNDAIQKVMCGVISASENIRAENYLALKFNERIFIQGVDNNKRRNGRAENCPRFEY